MVARGALFGSVLKILGIVRQAVGVRVCRIEFGLYCLDRNRQVLSHDLDLVQVDKMTERFGRISDVQSCKGRAYG